MSTTTTSHLFTPIPLGPLTLSHRIVMAPMTRMRTTPDGVPLKIVKEYYAQRASTPGTFLISEGTIIAPKAGGMPGAPGIWSEEQIAAWKEIAETVHSKNSFIFLQIAACGRPASLSYLQSLDASYTVVSPGSIPLSSPTLPGGTTAPPHVLTIPEIHEYIQLFAQAADNAVHKAGFDGVEIHGAHGYLVDEFIQDVSNDRKDEYGGSVENRVRFVEELVKAVSDVVGEEKVGLKVSPWDKYQDMGMKDPIPTFSYLTTRLKQNHPNMAYIHVVEPRLDLSSDEDAFSTTSTSESGSAPKASEPSNDFIQKIWSPKVLIRGGGLNRDTALEVTQTDGVLVAIGRRFTSNPDLPTRLKKNLPLSMYDRSTFYGGDESGKGYTDYGFAEAD